MLLTTAIVGPSSIRLETKTNNLRFVTRDGRKVLQQCFTWASTDRLGGGVEWRDVPLEDETS